MKKLSQLLLMIVLLLSVVQTTYAIEQVFYPTNKWLTWDSTLDYIDDLSNIQAEDNIRSTLRTSTMITPIRGNGLSFDFSSLPTTGSIIQSLAVEYIYNASSMNPASAERLYYSFSNKEMNSPYGSVGSGVIFDQYGANSVIQSGSYLISSLSGQNLTALSGFNLMLINDGELGFDYIRVRLNYTLPVYNIIFVDYNGTVLQTGTVLYGSSVVAPVSPIRTGYTFSGWNPSDLTNITGDTIFTGEYTINNFTLFFEENGGTPVLDQTGIVYNTSGIVPSNPIKTGYTFSGWYLSGASTSFDFSTPIIGDITLYAQRNIAKHNVIFVDYDSTVLQTGIVQYGSSAIAPVSPMRTGYTFSGWNPNDLTNITGDKIFTGEYIHTVYTLSFDTVGGNTIAPITGYYMSGVIVPNNPTKTGYIFLGWNEVVPTTMPLGNKTYVAQRKQETVSPGVTGYAGGGGGIPPQPPISTSTNSIVTDIYNPSISSTCFQRGDEKTIDQGIKVTELFKQAHQMLYSYELTKWQGTRDYRPYSHLTREEAARFMTEFAINVLCRKPTKNYTNNFIDISDADQTLQSYIKKSYEYAIFQGDGGLSTTTFRPKDRITKDEISAILIRLVTNKFYEESSDTNRAIHYKKILEGYTPKTSLKNLTRSNIAEVIYDMYRNNDYLLNNVGYIIK